MLLRNTILVLVLVGLVAAPAGAITFEYITSPTAGLGGFDLTYDGSRAVVNFSGQVYLMDSAGNFTLIATLPPPSAGRTSISADGKVIVTNSLNSEGFGVPVILREADGWVPEEIPSIYGNCDYSVATAYDLDGTGTRVTGLCWEDGCNAKTFLWTEETGMQDLGPTRGTSISQDGQVIGGFNASSRRPAYWTIDGNIGSDSILLHHEEDHGEVYDITTNGEVLVGIGLPYGYDPILTGYQAFRYEMGDTNFTLLGTLSGNPNDISQASYIADNGVIVGTSGPTTRSVKTFIWTPEIGMTSLKQYLIDEGVDIPGSVSMTWPRAFSKDGSVFIGEYIDLYGGWGFYRVDFGKTSSVQDVARRAARLTDVSPNPFNPMTTISFSLEKEQKTTVTVFDIAGRKIDVLANREFSAGDHELVWRGKSLTGQEMPSGTYIVHLGSAEGSDSRTISLVR